MFNADIIPTLLDGAWVTVQVTFFAALLGTATSIISGLSSMSPWRAVRWLARTYVEVFRGTSAIVQLFWLYFAVPLVAPFAPEFVPESIFRLPPLLAGVIVLGLNMGSYGSEVVRGAIQAVPRGQYEASVALSLTPTQRMRYVIFPQAVVGMLPPYGNLLIELLKGTALVSLITLHDMTFLANDLRTRAEATSLEAYSTILVMYFIIALAITAIVRSAERFFSRGLDIGRGA